MADRKLSYVASSALAVTSIASLASSSTLTAGAETGAYDNSTNLYTDIRVAGEIKVGTTPTANTQIEIWIVPEIRDGVYPDVFDGTDSAETVTNRECLKAVGRLGAVIDVVSTTSNVAYPFTTESMVQLFGFVPRKFITFVVHNCVAALNASGHTVSVQPIYETVT